MTRYYVFENSSSRVGALFDGVALELPALHDYLRRGDKLYRVVAREWDASGDAVHVNIYVNDASVTEVA